jgi:hypothetical protein
MTLSAGAVTQLVFVMKVLPGLPPPEGEPHPAPP